MIPKQVGQVRLASSLMWLRNSKTVQHVLMMEVKGKHSNFTEKCERQKDQLLIAKEENLKHGV